MSACLKRVLVTHRTESVCFVVNKQFFFVHSDFSLTS